jgi:O-antigen/teichoic acid export membrane protein
MADSVAGPAGAGPAGGRTRGYLASTVKHGGIYLLGTVLSRLAGFIMLPVYTRLLTTADYGIMEILSLTTDVLGMLAGLGIRSAVMRLYHQYEGTDQQAGVVGTAQILTVAIFGTLATVGLLLAPQISEALLGPAQDPRYVRLALLGFAFGVLGDVPGTYLQARQRSRSVVTANMVRLLLALSLNILFVVVLRLGVAGIFYSTILSSLCVGGFLAGWLVRLTGIRFVPRLARELIAYGWPLVASQVGSFVLHFSDRYYLRYYHALAIVGIYSLSYKFALLIGMFVSGPFHAIWSSKALEIERREGPEAPPILRDILKQYNLAVVSAALGIALFATDAIHLMLGAEFHAADRPVPLLAVAMAFFCFRHISQTGAVIRKRTGLIAITTSAAAVVALALNTLLIPRWGAEGAAAATAGAFAAEFLTMRLLSERAYAIGLSLRETLAPLLIASGCWLLAWLAVPAGTHQLVGMAVRVGAFALYAIVLSATGILSGPARRMLVRSVRDPKSIMKALRSA